MSKAVGYDFQPATHPEHFVTAWIAYASQCTDASHEYHEAAALWLLACASPGVRARLSAWPKGLATNLYLLLVGPPGAARKSTAAGLAVDVLSAAIPHAILPDRITPEGMIEQLSKRSHQAAGWAIDEFTALLVDIHKKPYMAPLRELLQTVYGGRDYEYRRHSKRVKGGGVVEDVDRIENPHLCILGGATPFIYQMLTLSDLATGFLPRFAVIAPEEKPARLPFYGMQRDPTVERNRLVQWLHDIHTWACRTPPIYFEQRALEVLDSYAAELEEMIQKEPEDTRNDMRQRLPEIALKVAMLIAIGDVDPHNNTELQVTDLDAQAALTIVRRWGRYNEQMAERIQESWFETKLQQALRVLLTRQRVSLRDLARAVRVSKRWLDEIVDTLLTRGLVELIAPTDGRFSPTLVLLHDELHDQKIVPENGKHSS